MGSAAHITANSTQFSDAKRRKTQNTMKMLFFRRKSLVRRTDELREKKTYRTQWETCLDSNHKFGFVRIPRRTNALNRFTYHLLCSFCARQIFHNRSEVVRPPVTRFPAAGSSLNSHNFSDETSNEHVILMILLPARRWHGSAKRESALSALA